MNKNRWNIINKNKIKSKRLAIAIIALIINYLIFAFALYKNMDVVAIASSLSILNAPTLGYIFAETLRKSDK